MNAAIEPRPPTLFDVPPQFSGQTYEPEHDEKRLTGQLLAVWTVLQDRSWHTLAELHARCGGSEAGVSARLRDLRKPAWGAHTIERRRRTQGQYEYRLRDEVQAR